MSCKEIVLNEISKFKFNFRQGGMTFDEYRFRSQKIKKNIDFIFDNYIKQARFLLFSHRIDMNQYIDLKMRIDRSRLYYKRLVSSW